MEDNKCEKHSIFKISPKKEFQDIGFTLKLNFAVGQKFIEHSSSFPKRVMLNDYYIILTLNLLDKKRS